MNRWTVVVATPGRTWVQELQGGRTAVVGQAKGTALEIANAGLLERHLSLLPRDDGVLVEPLRGGAEVLINDIPATGQTTVRSGDELRVGEARLLFTMQAPVVASRPRIASHDELIHRLDEEVRRSGTSRPLGLALVASPGLNVAARQALVKRVVDEAVSSGAPVFFGEVSTELHAVVLPEVSGPVLSALFSRFPTVVGPRASVAMARGPEDGVDAHALLGRCWDNLMGQGLRTEPVYVDPSMIRLAGLLENLAGDEGAVCAVGPAGTGRRTLLEGLARAAGRGISVVSVLDAPGLTRALHRPGDWVLARDVDRLDPEELSALLGKVKTRLLATASRPPAGHLFPHVIEVPPLSSRRDDVIPLAEAFVSRARAAVGRPRLTLGSEAQAMLLAWQWPGNVRELSNVLMRAAYAAVRDEIGRDALPARLSTETTADDFRSSMKSAEREVLLEALARTRWNVTAAATRLGMPRRTIVHRMRLLGLKRPTR